VQKVSANFHDANGNMTGFGRAATAIGKAGAVTATVYALAEATSLLLDQVHRARFGDADVSKLGSDLLKFGKDGAAAGELAREFGTDVDDLVEKLEMASKWGENSAITTGQKLELWAKGYKDAANDIDALDKALAQMVTGGNPELATAAFNRLTRGMDDKQVAAFKKQLDDWDGAKAGAKFTGELAKETEQLAEETEAGGAVLLEYEKRQKSVGDALKARTEREKDLTEQIEALYEASIAVIDAELAREKALDAVNDGTHEVNKAQQEYNDTVAKYGRNSAEALTAQDRLADATRGLKGDFLGAAGAAVRLAEDQAKARGESISAEERQRLYRTELERFASTLSPSSPLRTQLQGYIDKLNETPSVIKTEALIEWVDSRGYLNLGGGRRAMATGGRADAFQPYLTGEGGRSEIFVPDRGGFILSAKDAKDAIGGSGMTFAPSITISNPVAESSTDSIRRELRFIAHAMSVA
jgi:trimeric autotransporter adhesin